MLRPGDVLDAVAAFAAAAVGGSALFLPFAFSTVADSGSPYRITSLVNSVPRGAALGLIVAMVVAVLLYPVARPMVGWLVGAGGALALGLNYLIGLQMSSADVLTTQNYVDSLCGGVVFGAAGISALRRTAPAAGFTAGTVAIFVYGELVALFDANGVLAGGALHAPRWLIVLAAVVLLASAYRHRYSIMLGAKPRLAADLPITPILATTILAIVLLLVTEWMSGQYDDDRTTTVRITVGVVVTVLAAFVAALLLPGRDGAGLLPAVSLAAAADALGDAPRLSWGLLTMTIATAVGILLGLRYPLATLTLLGSAAIAAIAAVGGYFPTTPAWYLGNALIAGTGAFACTALHPRYLPIGVLTRGALYLPSITWAVPTRNRNWPAGGTFADAGFPGRIALSVTFGSAVALYLLYRIRRVPQPAGS
ncbi:hypothetical protein ACWEVD_11975 [Nocardia thailandica]|uniref:hypothetical protein n=1 Tax=Nocardia thailandica TaxID=257275 RepID=UPI0012FBAED7|nr:hypothetical protein [Nocardia thailandica]